MNRPTCIKQIKALCQLLDADFYIFNTSTESAWYKQRMRIETKKDKSYFINIYFLYNKNKADIYHPKKTFTRTMKYEKILKEITNVLSTEQLPDNTK